MLVSGSLTCVTLLERTWTIKSHPQVFNTLIGYFQESHMDYTR